MWWGIFIVMFLFVFFVLCVALAFYFGRPKCPKCKKGRLKTFLDCRQKCPRCGWDNNELLPDKPRYHLKQIPGKPRSYQVESLKDKGEETKEKRVLH